MKLTVPDRDLLLKEIRCVANAFTYAEGHCYDDDDCRAVLQQIRIARNAADRLSELAVRMETKLKTKQTKVIV